MGEAARRPWETIPSIPDPVPDHDEGRARKTTEEPASGPPTPPKGRYAGIGNGRVLIVSDSLDEVVRRLDEAGADRRYVEIWEVATGARPYNAITLKRAYGGPHNVYLVRVQIPELAFDRYLSVAGISTPPQGFHGVACFCFLNGFSYGNFGDPGQYGLEI
jgi:hypothetical protein